VRETYLFVHVTFPTATFPAATFLHATWTTETLCTAIKLPRWDGHQPSSCLLWPLAFDQAAQTTVVINDWLTRTVRDAFRWDHEVYAYVPGAAETGSGDPAEKGIG
jgi:hypothetical protein